MGNQAPYVVGVLLAAGAGRRYGMPKVLVDGWLTAAVTALRDGGCGDVVVILGAAEVVVPEGVTAVTAPDWQTGLSASLRTGLRTTDRMGADYAVLQVVDTPDVGAPVVARVLRAARQSETGLARAVYGNQPGHPVVLARPHWAPALASAVGDRGAATYLSSAGGLMLVDCTDIATGRDHDEPPR